MKSAIALLMLLTATVRTDGFMGLQQPPVTYEIYAIRFGTLPQFRVSGLIQGADPSRRLDIPVMVWLLKGSDGKRVLVDSGFYQKKFVDQWKVVNFRTPASLTARVVLIGAWKESMSSMSV